MGDKIIVILNAYGGRLSEQEKVTLVEQAMQTAGLEYQLELTQYAGHATELAQQAILDGWPIIVAAGGDGTIHEVIVGFHLSPSQWQMEKQYASAFSATRAKRAVKL